jgi:DNA repair protein RecO (recombination protein O)
VVLGFRPDASDLMPFVGEHYPVIERLMTSSFGESMLVPLSGAVRNELADRILRYIEFHSETSVNVKSLNVLRELFSGTIS